MGIGPKYLKTASFGIAHAGSVQPACRCAGIAGHFKGGPISRCGFAAEHGLHQYSSGSGTPSSMFQVWLRHASITAIHGNVFCLRHVRSKLIRTENMKIHKDPCCKVQNVASATQRKITQCDSAHYDVISSKIKHHEK